MILGQNTFFLTPCDSHRELANNVKHIPKVRKSLMARFMPTSWAMDRVVEKRRSECS